VHLRATLWLILLLLVPPAPARAGEAALCASAIRAAEAEGPVPAGLLGAVALSESGRYDPALRRVVPWPWTVNSQGEGRYFATKTEAVAFVEQLRRAGRRNIDVGCMQVNLLHHPDAFATLEEAFDPATNVAYGGDFLTRLRQDSPSWARAVERYHTADAERGRAYRERVYARWQDVQRAGLPEEALPAGTVQAAADAPRVYPGRLLPPAGPGRGFLSLRPAAGRIAVLRPSPPQPAGARQGLVPVRQALARQAPMGRAPMGRAPMGRAPMGRAPMGRAPTREAMAAGGADTRRPGSLVPLRSLRGAQAARRALVPLHPPSAPRAAPLLRAIPALRG
jgi:hypothetical protein